jgi:hypothetical protein
MATMALARAAVSEVEDGFNLAVSRSMTWLYWLTAVVVVVALAALLGLQPTGGRNVAHTRLMGVGRVVLILLVLLFAVLAVRSGFAS